MKTYVMDACALIAFFNQEKGADNVEHLLMKNCPCLMSIINIYEVCYDAAKMRCLEDGMKVYQEIKLLPLTIIREVGEDTMKEAIHFKVNYKVSVADSIALGLAKVNNAVMVTADHHEFDVIAQAGELEFHWIR